MAVALKGSSAMVLTAGILLLSRSRNFGQPLAVSVVGDPPNITPVLGPAMVHAPVLASCGIGRELGAGALVIVPGPAAEPLAVSLAEDGTSDWFLVDRAGGGLHPASRAFVSLCRSADPHHLPLARALRKALAAVGCPAEPALFDLLCGAPAPPLTRLSLALRAGQAMAAHRRVAIFEFLDDSPDTLPDPLDGPVDAVGLHQAMTDGRLAALVERAAPSLRQPLNDWLSGMARYDPDGRFLPLVCGLVEVLGHIAAMPPLTMLPPLPPAADAIAVGLGAALGAGVGQTDASQSLSSMFRFLGGSFAEVAPYPVELASPPPPDDRLARWEWFCRATRGAADTADTLWRRIVDPPC